jgi:hypothetical protein
MRGFTVAVVEEGESNYYLRRAAEERRCALAAKAHAVKQIHMHLAQLLEERGVALRQGHDKDKILAFMPLRQFPE